VFWVDVSLDKFFDNKKIIQYIEQYYNELWSNLLWQYKYIVIIFVIMNHSATCT